MNAEGIVSLWISEDADAGTVERAFLDDYSEDGDWIPHPFASAFGFTHLNPSTCEANALNASTTSVREAVEGFSYASLIGERFARVLGENLPSRARSIVLLYDLAYSGTLASAIVAGATWTFVGSVRYLP